MYTPHLLSESQTQVETQRNAQAHTHNHGPKQTVQILTTPLTDHVAPDRIRTPAPDGYQDGNRSIRNGQPSRDVIMFPRTVVKCERQTSQQHTDMLPLDECSATVSKRTLTSLPCSPLIRQPDLWLHPDRTLVLDPRLRLLNTRR